MKILDLRVDMMYGWGNDPRIELLVDGMPDDFVYRHHEGLGLWFAENGGCVSYFSWKGPHAEEGYGEREFPIQVYRGTATLAHLYAGLLPTETVILKGPWSSRASVMNGVGLWPQCTEVALTDDPKVWERGFTFLASAVTMSLLEPELAKRGLLIKTEMMDRERGKLVEVRYKLEKPPQCEVRDVVNGKLMSLGKAQDYRCRLPLGHKGNCYYGV